MYSAGSDTSWFRDAQRQGAPGTGRTAEAGAWPEEAQESFGHQYLRQAVPAFAAFEDDAARCDALPAAAVYGAGAAFAPPGSTFDAQVHPHLPPSGAYPHPSPHLHQLQRGTLSYYAGPQAPPSLGAPPPPSAPEASSEPGVPAAYPYPYWLGADVLPAGQGCAAGLPQPSSHDAHTVAGLGQFRSASGDAGQPYEQASLRQQAYDSFGMGRAREKVPLPAVDIAQGTSHGVHSVQLQAHLPGYRQDFAPPSHGDALPVPPPVHPESSTQARFEGYWTQQSQHPQHQGPQQPLQPSPLVHLPNPYDVFASPVGFHASLGHFSAPAYSLDYIDASAVASSSQQHFGSAYPFAPASVAPSTSSTVTQHLSPASAEPPATASDYSAASHATIATAVPSAVAPDASGATKRTRKLGTAAGSAPFAPTRSKASQNANKKLTVDLPAACTVCARPIARLMLRGKRAELDVPHAAVFRCMQCSSSAISPDLKDLGDKPKKPSFRKRNKRFDDASAPMACDVCLRNIAVGGVLPLPLDSSGDTGRIDFVIEVVCAACDVKYKRCSDCGGGGGSRAGTGKWRCAQLFPPGRKTCCLNHQRLGAFPAMEYTVWRNTEIPRDEIDALSKQCKAMFVNSMLAGLCIPEVMEQDGAVWSTFERCQQRAQMGWQGFDPIIRYDVERQRQIRRYVALRTCTPNLRKANKPAQSASNDSPTERPEPKISPEVEKPLGVVLKEGKEIAGFIIAENELLVGNLFLCLVLPWDPTGEIFDATSLLISSLVRHVDSDVKATNTQRAQMGQPAYPELGKVWTMLFFKRDSRVLTSLVKKRGFVYLNDYLAAHPEVPPEQFPPHRPIYLPIERQDGWEILVRQQRKMADGSVDDWGARRAADEERGKEKEVRAKSAAAKAPSTSSRAPSR